MDLFLKTIGAILVSVVLILALNKHPSAQLLMVTVCVMTAAVAISYLSPVKDLLQQLQKMAELQNGMMEILLNCTGIGLVSELTGYICQDAGMDSLKKAVQFLGNSVILYLSIPAFEAFLTLLKDILSEL